LSVWFARGYAAFIQLLGSRLTVRRLGKDRTWRWEKVEITLMALRGFASGRSTVG